MGLETIKEPLFEAMPQRVDAIHRKLPWLIADGRCWTRGFD